MISGAEAIALLQKELAGRVDSYDIFFAEGRGLAIEVKGGEVDALNVSGSSGIGLRVLRGGRLGFSFSTLLEGNTLKKVVAEALDGSSEVSKDDCLCFPADGGGEGLPEDLDLYDFSIDSVGEKDKIAMARTLEETAMGCDDRVRTIRKAAYRESRRMTRIVNSEGVDRAAEATFFSCSVMAVAEEKGDSQMGWEVGSGHHRDDLDVVEVGTGAAKRAVSMLGAQSIRPERCSLLIENSVVCELLGVLGASFSIENVEKGKSILGGKKGKRVAASSVTIVDDGRLPGGWGTSPFDGEGAMTGTTPLVTEGMCRAYLTDTYWSKRSGEQPTGNALRSTFRGLPRVGTTNLMMEGGKDTFNNLVSGMSRGFYITDLLGVHTINGVSGDFSLGASGYWVEDGDLSFPVRGMAISGNLMDLLIKIEAVGDDVRCRRSIGAPSIVVKDMEISGAA